MYTGRYQVTREQSDRSRHKRLMNFFVENVRRYVEGKRLINELSQNQLDGN